jgi:hypothetical protein
VSSLSRTAKVLFAVAALLGLVIFGIIVDFGVNAGVVHRGVTVSGLDVGGLTLEETQSALNDHRSRMRDSEVCFSAPDLETCLLPEEFGWFPNTEAIGATADSAYAVGRDGGLVVATGERLRAWAGDVNLTWPPAARPAKVTQIIDEWESELLEADLVLDRANTRAQIKKALATWPRRTVPLPLIRGGSPSP